MSEAVWYVIEADMYRVWAAIMAVHIAIAILLILFGGSKVDRSGAFGSRGTFSQRLFHNADDE